MLVATIGNFDGVHLGHRALVDRARLLAGGTGRVVAVTFDPLPAEFLAGSPRPRLARDRVALLRAAGADEVLVLSCDQALVASPPEEFLRGLRIDLPFEALVEGPDFRFGARRAGDIETLRRLGPILGFRTEVVEELHVRLFDGADVPARSTTIRWLLSHGRVADAALVLGRPYGVEGEVVRGEQRGRTLGIPTANVDTDGLLLPADGIYAGDATLPDGSTRRAAISIGTKPTFGEAERCCEAHLLGDALPMEYGWTLRLTLTRWLREQLRFEDTQSLCRQMARDIARCEEACCA